MKTFLPFMLSLLFLSGCMKDDNNSPEITTDPPTFGHVMSWIEIQKKVGEMSWVNIPQGQKLTFFSNFVDENLGLPNNGIVLYKPGVNINIKNNTSFERTDSTLIFHYNPFTAQADTVSLAYELCDSSTLVIFDETVTPTIRIKYKRGETR